MLRWPCVEAEWRCPRDQGGDDVEDLYAQLVPTGIKLFVNQPRKYDQLMTNDSFRSGQPWAEGQILTGGQTRNFCESLKVRI